MWDHSAKSLIYFYPQLVSFHFNLIMSWKCLLKQHFPVSYFFPGHCHMWYHVINRWCHNELQQNSFQLFVLHAVCHDLRIKVAFPDINKLSLVIYSPHSIFYSSMRINHLVNIADILQSYFTSTEATMCFRVDSPWLGQSYDRLSQSETSLGRVLPKLCLSIFP